MSTNQQPPAPTAHLHYGGSLNPKTGAIGPKPRLKTTFASQKRYETIIRLENAQFGDAAIAAMLCISVPRLRYYKKQPEYLKARIQITHGLIIDQEASMKQIKEQRREILTTLLPPALQCIANTLQEPATTIAEKKHKAAIALEVLDREGTFAKISRTEIKPVDSFDFESADAASRSIITAIRTHNTPATEQERVIRDAIKTSVAFQSGNTLTTEEQQAALTELEENTTLSPEELAAEPVSDSIN